MANFSSTGVLSLDCVLGGGWPAGQLAELCGQRGTGRTTLALHAAAAAQVTPGAAVGVISLPGPGSENAFDARYCSRLGVDRERLIGGYVRRPELIAPYFKTFTCAQRRRALDLVIIELGDFTERAKPEREYLEGLLAVQLRLFTAKRRKTSVLFVSDGSLDVLQFFALTRVQLIYEGDAITGDAVVTAHVDKCATAPAGRQCSLQITPGDGVDLVKDLARAAAFAGVLKSGDLEDMCQKLREDERTRSTLQRIVKSKIALGTSNV